MNFFGQGHDNRRRVLLISGFWSKDNNVETKRKEGKGEWLEQQTRLSLSFLTVKAILLHRTFVLIPALKKGGVAIKRRQKSSLNNERWWRKEEMEEREKNDDDIDKHLELREWCTQCHRKGFHSDRKEGDCLNKCTLWPKRKKKKEKIQRGGKKDVLDNDKQFCPSGEKGQPIPWLGSMFVAGFYVSHIHTRETSQQTNSDSHSKKKKKFNLPWPKNAEKNAKKKRMKWADPFSHDVFLTFILKIVELIGVGISQWPVRKPPTDNDDNNQNKKNYVKSYTKLDDWTDCGLPIL